eukprot:GEMP01111713.1.p1 GENE.GEMP01111713.1~~GEMP01111713.1.p1  ORF type:complete len:155 (+),score=27.90 GEMP01111713.1:152-616(+)
MIWILALLSCAIAEVAEPTRDRDILHAASDGDVDRIKDILREDPSQINRTNDHGESALHTASIGAAEILPVFKVLGEAGADVNRRTTGKHTRTPLHWMMFSQAQDAVHAVAYLVKKGAKPEIKSEEGKDAFDYAKQTGRTEFLTIFRKLVEDEL